jgi:hypothetical protein
MIGAGHITREAEMSEFSHSDSRAGGMILDESMELWDN